MITRDIIRELAAFQSPEGNAVTFYYQPSTPADRSHRQEAIAIKDLVKDTMHRAERAGKNGHIRPDLERILQMAEQFHGNQGKAKAVYACSSQGYWREFDVPAQIPGTQLLLNSRFHIKPLANLMDSIQTVCVCLVDRTRARFLELKLDEITEKESFFDEITRRGRSDGFVGFDAGHAERRAENEAANHFKRVNERLMERWGNGSCDSILIGGHGDEWPAIDRQLHPYVMQRVVDHFVIDPGTLSLDDVRQHAMRVLKEHHDRNRETLMKEVFDEARANNNGALGLKRVLRSMELGEVQSLLLGEGFTAPGVDCTNCGHLDMRMVSQCAVCGQPTREIDDLSDALVSRALSAGLDVVPIPSNPEFEKAGNIGALLRFRAERSVGEKLAS